MNDQPEFAAYLHNPWAYPSKKGEAAILCFTRKQRFVGGYDVNEHLLSLLSRFFSDSMLLHKEGLQKYYNLLKKEVIEKKLIGLILYGTNINDEHNSVINLYTTVNNTQIELTIKSICIFLVRDYIKKENVDDLCVSSPNFHIYYK
jgi:hypothetical protein